MRKPEYCCEDFKYQDGMCINKWNDDGDKDEIDSVWRLGFADYGVHYWSDPIKFCPFCGTNLLAPQNTNTVTYDGRSIDEI